MSDDIELRKHEIRAAVRARRAALTEAELTTARDGFTTQLIRLVEARGARSLSCYMPLRSEPDTRGFITWLETSQLRVLFPSSRDDGLLDWIRPTWDGTVPGKYGIPEPLGIHVSPLAVSDVDLMLIPACAVDRGGMRLGWGRGYFDRSLGSMDRRPPTFAVVYDEDLVDSVPREVHDVPVTGVVTPTQVVYLDQSTSPESTP